MNIACSMSIVNLIVQDGYGVLVIKEGNHALSEILKPEDLKMLKDLTYGVPYEFGTGNLDIVSNGKVTFTISKYVAEFDEVVYVEHTFSEKAFEDFINDIKYVRIV